MKPRTIPTAEQWAELRASALALAAATPALVETLGRIVDTCRAHPSTPDGYPAHGEGGPPNLTTGGDGALDPDDDEAGPTDDTSTERAALARVLGRQLGDPLDRATIAACADLAAALSFLAGLERKVADIGRLRAARDPWQDRPTACALMAEVGHYEAALVGTTTLGDLLADEQPVGRWCYDFARRLGRLPTEDERRAHADGKRVRVDVTRNAIDDPIAYLGKHS